MNWAYGAVVVFTVGSLAPAAVWPVMVNFGSVMALTAVVCASLLGEWTFKKRGPWYIVHYCQICTIV